MDGTTGLVEEDTLPVPAAFIAATVNVYDVPFVSPAIVIGELVPLAVRLPGLEVTTYPVIEAPPLDCDASKETIAWAFPATADGEPGALAKVYGTTVTVRLGDPWPTGVTADMRKS